MRAKKLPTPRDPAPPAPPANQVLLEAVFDSSLLALHVMRSVRDEAGTIVDFEVVLANAAAERMVGYPVRGLRMRQQWPTSLAVGLFEGVVQTVETRQPLDLEHYYAGEGLQAWYRWTAVPLDDGAVVSVENISPRKQAEADLLQLQLGLQRQVAQAVLETQEEERRRIAEALHNGIGQLLYAARLHLEGGAGKPGGLRAAEQILQQAIGAVRTLSAELTPSVLEELGLARALRQLSSLYPPQRLRVHWHLEGLAVPLPRPLSSAVYRLVQELLTNVAKHAQTSEARVHVVREPAQVVVIVEDNGVGFDADAPDAAPAGVGLLSLRHRVLSLGGHASIQSQPGRGTIVTLELPVPGLAF